MGKRIAERAPVLEDAAERVLLEEEADAGILLVDAAVEQSAVDLLVDLLAGIDDFAQRRPGVLLQIAHQP